MSLREECLKFYKLSKKLNIEGDYALVVSINYSDLDYFDVEVIDIDTRKQVDIITWRLKHGFGEHYIDTSLYERGYEYSMTEEEATEFVATLTSNLEKQVEIDKKETLAELNSFGYYRA